MTRASPRSYVQILRPHQWLKNGLVFLPLLAGHRFDLQAAADSFVAFVSFSLVASGAYVLNDLLDIASDRAHPRKRHRPFASGRIPVSRGSGLAAALILVGAAVATLNGPELVLVVLGYGLLAIAYSLWLKRLIVLDICVLAGLYTLRIVAGGVASDITLSAWLFAFSMFFFFSLAAIKRQAELVDMAERGETVANGRGYRVDDLPIVGTMALCAGYAAVLVLALYINSPVVRELYSRPAMLWGLCAILLYWLTRMVMVTHRGEMHDDPIVYAVDNPISLLCFCCGLGLILAGAFL